MQNWIFLKTIWTSFQFFLPKQYKIMIKIPIPLTTLTNRDHTKARISALM